MSARWIIAAALLASASPLAAQDVAIVNATVATGDGSAPLEGATVVVRSGKVIAAGRGVAVPASVQAIEPVTRDSSCHRGLAHEAGGRVHG